MNPAHKALLSTATALLHWNVLVYIPVLVSQCSHKTPLHVNSIGRLWSRSPKDGCDML